MRIFNHACGRVLRRPPAIALLLLLLVAPLAAQSASAVSPNVVISQVYGGNGNLYSADYVELFNRGSAPVSLTGWSVQYASATGTGNFGSNPVTALAGTLAPGQYYLVRLATATTGAALPAPDATGTVNISATAGKVALVNVASGLACNGGSAPCSAAQLDQIVDLVGYGTANFFEGTAAPAASNTSAIFRAANGCTDTDNNGADFAAGAPAPRNTASPLNVCGGPPPNEPVTISCPASLTTQQGFATSGAVTAADSDGTVSSLLINSPAIAGITLDNVAPAGGMGGQATATLNVAASTPPGVYAVQIVASNDDATPQTATCAVTVSVQTVLPIGAVQGSVGDGVDGTLHRSSFAPASGNGASTQLVLVQGVIYQKVQSRTSAGATNYGFFLQNTAATRDADANSSDGIFVFMGGFTSLIGGYIPQVGDEVLISGRVSEFFFLTQLSSAALVQKVRSGVDLEAELPAEEVAPPDDLAAANRYWERREGMRLAVPAGAVTVDGRDVFPGTADAEIWLIRGDHPVAQRAEPYARRVFRDPHPLDNDPALFDDGNGYRIMIASYGVKAAANDSLTLLPPVRTFETMQNRAVGGLYYTFSKYAIMPDAMPTFVPGVDPAANHPPTAIVNRAAEFSIATFNVENLYDYRDDPFDGCDFTGNSGCPGVNPPFDYVPGSEADYTARLGDLAQQIVGSLHAPDIVMVQEAEDQDICAVSAGALVCGASDNADGQPDTLQDLALAIAAAGGPTYAAAFDRDGSDDRGIIAAFLYRSDRVELLPALATDPVLGGAPAVAYRGAALPYNSQVSNPKALNAVLPADVDRSTGNDGNNVFTRDPQVGLFRIWRDGIGSGTPYDLYAISNHFSSTPNARVGQRTEQAAYNAAIVAALQAANPDVRVAVGGDFNVYPRPDDPFSPGQPLFPSDQLGPLYDMGLISLYDVVIAEAPVAAFSYVFQGQTQALDQIFVTPALHADLTQARPAHINADFPADYAGDGPRGTSDHDPSVARFCRDVTAPVIGPSPFPATLWPPNHQMVQFPAVAVSDDAGAPTSSVTVSANEPDNGLGDGDTAGDIVVGPDGSVALRAERSATGSGRVYTIVVTATDSCGNSSTSTYMVSVPLSQGRVRGAEADGGAAGAALYPGGSNVVFLPVVAQE